MQRKLFLPLMLLLLAPQIAATQQTAPDIAEPGSIEEIAHATTEAQFLSPWVAYLPSSPTAVSPRTFLHRIPGASGDLVNSTQAYAYCRALAAGIPIGFRTDSSVIPHGENAFEFLERVRLGEKPMDSLVSATSLNAEIMGRSDRVGTVESGKLADIIAVAGDPLANIQELTHVAFVMKGGVSPKAFERASS